MECIRNMPKFINFSFYRLFRAYAIHAVARDPNCIHAYIVYFSDAKANT